MIQTKNCQILRTCPKIKSTTKTQWKQNPTSLLLLSSQKMNTCIFVLYIIQQKRKTKQNWPKWNQKLENKWEK
jgi:hypothetical protein